MTTGIQQSVIPQRFSALADWIANVFGWRDVTLAAVTPLSGGAIQENWWVQVHSDGQLHDWVLRTDAPSAVATSMTRQQEYTVLCAAFEHGVRVPEPLQYCDDTSVIGSPFFIMQKASGVARPAAILRDPVLPDFGEALGQTLGRQLAKIHTISYASDALNFLLTDVPLNGSASLYRIQQYRAALDRLPERYPAIEYLLTSLAQLAPATTDWVVCHCDYRTGNFLVHQGELSAILDWEFTALGDWHEDLGWFLARCWRFGHDHLAAGGITASPVFLSAYEQASGRQVNNETLIWWQCMAEVRWAIIALQQAQRHSSGGEDSLELALTGRMVPAMVHNALVQLERRAGITCDTVTSGPKPHDSATTTPTTTPATPTERLLHTAVATYNGSLMPALPRDQRYNAAMVRRVMAIVSRELNTAHTDYRYSCQQQVYESAGLTEVGQTLSSAQIPLLDQQLAMLFRQANGVDTNERAVDSMAAIQADLRAGNTPLLHQAFAQQCLAELAINDPSFIPITVAGEQHTTETQT